MRSTKNLLKLITTILVLSDFIGITPASAVKDDDRPETTLKSTSITLKEESDQTSPERERKEAVRLYALGLMYFHGHGVEKDLAKAAVYFQQATNRNHKAAKHHLAHMYEKGQGVPIDMEKFRQYHPQNCGQGASLKNRSWYCFS